MCMSQPVRMMKREDDDDQRYAERRSDIDFRELVASDPEAGIVRCMFASSVAVRIPTGRRHACGSTSATPRRPPRFCLSVLG